MFSLAGLFHEDNRTTRQSLTVPRDSIHDVCYNPVGGFGLRLLLLNGPNLNLLGEREPEVYGSETWAQIEARLRTLADGLGVELEVRQSNGEGELIDILHAARAKQDGVIFNPGAYTHYSYALRDAVAAIGIPVVEVHLSLPESRERFRHKSVIAPACRGRIAGFGGESYALALRAFADGAVHKGSR